MASARRNTKGTTVTRVWPWAWMTWNAMWVSKFHVCPMVKQFAYPKALLSSIFRALSITDILDWYMWTEEAVLCLVRLLASQGQYFLFMNESGSPESQGERSLWNHLILLTGDARGWSCIPRRCFTAEPCFRLSQVAPKDSGNCRLTRILRVLCSRSCPATNFSSKEKGMTFKLV